MDELLVSRRAYLVADLGVIERGRYVDQMAAFRRAWEGNPDPRDRAFPVLPVTRKRNAADRIRARLLLDYYVPAPAPTAGDSISGSSLDGVPERSGDQEVVDDVRGG
jgi:hypothetical protein